jgi:hypothetical protein
VLVRQGPGVGRLIRVSGIANWSTMSDVSTHIAPLNYSAHLRSPASWGWGDLDGLQVDSGHSYPIPGYIGIGGGGGGTDLEPKIWAKPPDESTP